jgi:hypothetical protein
MDAVPVQYFHCHSDEFFVILDLTVNLCFVLAEHDTMFWFSFSLVVCRFPFNPTDT